MSQISITVDGAKLQVEADQRPTHIFAENREIVVCKVNGVLKDLWTDLVDGDVVELDNGTTKLSSCCKGDGNYDKHDADHY